MAQRVIGLWAVIAISAGMAAQPVSFETPRAFSVAGTGGAAVGDFNGDGRADVALASANGVQVLLGDGRGGFQPGVTYAIPSQGIIAADFNHDGKIDLAVGASGVLVLIGNGDGTFQPPQTYAGGNPTLELSYGDFNGDGSLDILAVNQSNLSVLLNNGDGTFGTAMDFGNGHQYGSLATGDFNGDGKLDVAAATSVTEELPALLFLGNGDGTFQAPTSIGAASLSRLAAADFNGDGRLDLAGTVCCVPGGVAVFLGNGDGTFQPRRTIFRTNFPDSVFVADFNLDGKPDLVEDSRDGLLVFLGKGDGTFHQPIQPFIGSAGVAAIGDFNGDDKPDLLGLQQFGFASILLGKGDGRFMGPVQYQQPSFARAPESVIVADFNHDGKPDVAEFDPPNLWVRLNRGDGSLRQAVSYKVGGAPPRFEKSIPTDFAAGDFSGHGDLDLAIVLHQTGEVGILPGAGDGSFGSEVKIPVGANPISVVTGDLNGDGKADLVVGRFGRISVLLSKGGGQFRAPIDSLIDANPYSMVVADFNGDGIPDVVAADRSPGSLAILIGNGDGTFQTPRLRRAGAGPAGIAVGDFNGDGKLDLAIAKLDEIAILLGNGDGTFGPEVNYSLGSNLSFQRIVVADFNGDGKLDIATLDMDSGNIAVLAGNGRGAFGSPRYFLASAGRKTLPVLPGFAAGDLNGDGKADLAVAAGNLSILMNETR